MSVFLLGNETASLKDFIDNEIFWLYDFIKNENSWKSLCPHDQLRAMLIEQFDAFWKKKSASSYLK